VTDSISSSLHNRIHLDGVSTSCLKFSEVSYRYPSANLDTLNEISVEISSGQYVALLGPNGAGKSTLLKILTGLLKPTQGRVEICCVSGTNSRASIGFVPQSSGSAHRIFPATVYEVVLSGRTPQKGLFRPLTAIDRRLTLEALKTVGLEDHQHKLITDLSGGERQKIFLARALAGQPTILILDEPMTDIDSDSRQSFYQLLKELNRTLNLTIVFVSHDIETIVREVDRVIYLNRQVIFDGPSDQFDLNHHH